MVGEKEKKRSENPVRRMGEINTLVRKSQEKAAETIQKSCKILAGGLQRKDSIMMPALTPAF